MKVRVCLFIVLSSFSLLYAESTEEKEEVALGESSVFTTPPVDERKLGVAPPSMPEPVSKSSFVAVGLSWLAPGLGSFYLGDTMAGVGLLSTYTLSAGLEGAKVTGGDLAIAQNSWFYGVYSAYRDVRIFNHGRGYLYEMPKDSLKDLVVAPFRWRVIKKPEVWGGLLGALYLAGTISYYCYPTPKEARVSLDVSEAAIVRNPFCAFPVGIGEEAFFRGYLQPFFTERTNPVGGIILSSLLFGAVHAGNAAFLEPQDRWRYYAFSLPYITSMGAYFGWLTYKNTSLQESVALHSWYDFILFSVGALGVESVAKVQPKCAFLFSF
jgi:membrane protease YdiL (CAAX protease family)/TM2 domain-containing membrane protein YozV